MGYKTVEVREIAIQHRVNGAAIAAAVAVLREILGLASCLPLGTAIEIQSLFMFSLLAKERANEKGIFIGAKQRISIYLAKISQTILERHGPKAIVNLFECG